MIKRRVSGSANDDNRYRNIDGADDCMTAVPPCPPPGEGVTHLAPRSVEHRCAFGVEVAGS